MMSATQSTRSHRGHELMDPALARRFRRLFRFYDRDGDGRLTLAGDFSPVAAAIGERWAGRVAPFPDLGRLLLDTYRHENARRDADHKCQIQH